MPYDYTEFTEVDAGGHIDVDSSTKITFEDLNAAAVSYVHLSSQTIPATFKVRLKVKLTEYTQDISEVLVGLFGVSSGSLTIDDMNGESDGFLLTARALRYLYPPYYDIQECYFTLYNYNGGNEIGHYAATMQTEYYIELERGSSNCYMRIYSDNFVTLLNEYSNTTNILGSGFTDVIGLNSNGNGSADHAISGSVEFLSIDYLDGDENGDLKVATPTADPAEGTYGEPQNIALLCATSEADIRYTLDGTTPDEDSSLYSSGIGVVEDKVIKAKGYKTGYDPSDVATFTYDIDIGNANLDSYYSDLDAYCFYCGNKVFHRRLTQPNRLSANRRYYCHNCGQGELIQRKYPNQQQEKYAYANRNRR